MTFRYLLLWFQRKELFHPSHYEWNWNFLPELLCWKENWLGSSVDNLLCQALEASYTYAGLRNATPPQSIVNNFVGWFEFTYRFYDWLVDVELLSIPHSITFKNARWMSRRTNVLTNMSQCYVYRITLTHINDWQLNESRSFSKISYLHRSWRKTTTCTNTKNEKDACHKKWANMHFMWF